MKGRSWILNNFELSSTAKNNLALEDFCIILIITGKNEEILTKTKWYYHDINIPCYFEVQPWLKKSCLRQVLTNIVNCFIKHRDVIWVLFVLILVCNNLLDTTTTVNMCYCYCMTNNMFYDVLGYDVKLGEICWSL